MRVSCVVSLGLLFVATAAEAEETYYQAAVKQLRIVEGQLPPTAGVRFSGWRSERAKALSPTVRIEGPGEAFLNYPVAKWTTPKQFESIVLAVRVPKLCAWLSASWTVTMLICKDAVQEPVPTLLADLRANLVLVPCLSFKMDAFRSAAGTIATRTQGITLVANAAISVRGTRRRGRPGSR